MDRRDEITIEITQKAYVDRTSLLEEGQWWCFRGANSKLVAGHHDI
jgi:hypothetical protein